MQNLFGSGLLTKQRGSGSISLETQPEPEKLVPTVVSFRTLRKRQHSEISDTVNTSFINILGNIKVDDAPIKHLNTSDSAKRRKRPLLTELFEPKKDSDLSIYEQYARHVRSFFIKWSAHVDGDPQLPPKVLIVSGPTGCGKTKTIEIISRKYGFRLIDLVTGEGFATDMLNASSTASENTGEVPPDFEAKYSRHGVSRPWFTNSEGKIVWDSRPACVHLDCIDGLTGADAKRFQRDIVNTAFKAKRPIVIVCANRYAPAVVELRHKPYVQEAAFFRPALYDLRKYISRLAESRDIAIRRVLLESALDTYEGDIRATLIALQFAFIHATATSHGPAAATALLNNKRKEPNLELLEDTDLQKLFDRVYDYSLETDICWDMEKVVQIGEWNTLCDYTRNVPEHDGYKRATLRKYRYLFQTGKSLPLRAPPNNYDLTQRVRDTVNRVHSGCDVSIQQNYSKRLLLVELLPLLCSMTLSKKPQGLAQILWDAGLRSITKSKEGDVEFFPDICLFGQVSATAGELISQFQHISMANRSYTVGATKSKKQSRRARQQENNWLKRTKTVSSQDGIRPGVWLDFKPSDDNQAKRSIGLRDLLS